MSLRNTFVLLVALSALAFLAACGGGNSGTITNPNPTPSGAFSNSNLNGTYVFSVSGTDSSGAAYSMAGTLTANGGGSGCNSKGKITGGTLDIADINTSEFTSAIADASLTGSYCIGQDGRGQASVTTNIGGGFPTLTFDFVLQDSSHGLITEFDSFGSSSGTLDLQSASVTPSGPYAFVFSGATYTGSAFASAGNFTVGTGGAISAGAADFNDGAAAAYPNEALSGSVVVSSTSPSTTFTTSTYPNLVFDVFPIDSTHLKFIEIDTTAIQSGDAFSQTSTTMPTGTLAFTLAGELSSTAFAAGGFMVTDGAGNITSSSSEDFNEGGTLSPATSPTFTGTYASTTGNAGRYTLTGFSGFTGGTTYAAYPSSGGVLLLEIDASGSINGITTGAAYAQASGATFAASEGYALNLSGVYISAGSEVDDIAEFTANSSGTTITGAIDENSAANGTVAYGAALSGTYAGPTNGQGQISANAGNSSNTTLNTGFLITFYTVDGTTFPFIESDNGQVATGVFVKQNVSAAAGAIVSPNRMFVPHPIIRSHSLRTQPKQK